MSNYYQRHHRRGVLHIEATSGQLNIFSTNDQFIFEVMTNYNMCLSPHNTELNHDPRVHCIVIQGFLCSKQNTTNLATCYDAI